MFTKELLLMMYAEEAHERAYDNRPAPYMWEFLEKVMMTHLRGVGQAELEYMLDLVYTEETKAAILEAWIADSRMGSTERRTNKSSFTFYP